MEKYLINKVKNQKSIFYKTFEQLRMKPISINDNEQARMLLYEYIRDCYRVPVEDKEHGISFYYTLINVIEVAFEQIAFNQMPQKTDVYAILRMSDACYNYMIYIHKYNKQNRFYFVRILGSVYLFLLNSWYKRLTDKNLIYNEVY